MRFDIVTADSKDQFIKAVNEAIADGWELQGGPFTTTYSEAGESIAFAPSWAIGQFIYTRLNQAVIKEG